MHTPFKLKLLNGPLCGRELFLPLGPFTLGDDESDLLLPLEGGNCATLEVTADAVLLTSITPCWVAGQCQAPGPLPLLQAIDLGGIHLVLGESDAELGTPTVPPRDTPRRRIASVLLATLLLAGALGWALQPEPQPHISTPQEWLPLALHNEPGLSAHWLGDNALELAGHCHDSSQLLQLTTRLHASGVRLRQLAVCDDDLQRSIQALLASNGYPDVTVTLDERGNAEIDGPVEGDTEVLASELDTLPGLASWHLSDHGANELASLLSKLQRASLLSGLSATRNDQGWLLSGQLDPQRQARLEMYLQQLNAEPWHPQPVRFIGSGNHANADDYLPAPIASIGGNTQDPYLLLTNGMRLLPGSPVQQGMHLVAITPDGVSIAGSHALIFLPLQS